MPRQDGRIEQGQSLKSAISARAWNRAQDAADIVLGQRYGTQAVAATSTRAPFTALPCKNISGQDVPLWGVLRIDGLEVSPTSDAHAAATKNFQMVPILRGNTPTASTNDAFVIAVEPIRNGAVGQVAVDGVVQVKLDVLNTADVTARPKANSRTELQTGGGNATILWKQSGTGSGKWGLVRIGTARNTRIGLISGGGTWIKGDVADVLERNADGSAITGNPTFLVTNNLATITHQSDLQIIAVAVGDTWALAAWNWHAISGYGAHKQQVLTHAANGGMTWIDTTSCG